MPYLGVVDLQRRVRIYNQSYFATIKINNKCIVESKRDGNDNKSTNTEYKSARLYLIIKAI